MKLKGTALVFALFTVFIISVIMASLVLFTNSSDMLVLKHNTQRKLIRNSTSGIYYYMIHQKELKSMQMDIDLFDEKKDSVGLKIDHWGLFDIIISRAHFKNDEFLRSAMIGEKIFEKSNTSLYLCDKNSSLSISGQTEIRGTAYLPKSGVERAYIEGQNYSGSELIYGEQKQSEQDLPDLNKQVTRVFRGVSDQEDEVIHFAELDDGPLYRSFEQTALRVFFK